jgi:hypothetical protein
MTEFTAKDRAFCAAHGSGLLLASVWHRNQMIAGRVVDATDAEVAIRWPGGEQVLSRSDFDRETAKGYLELLD